MTPKICSLKQVRLQVKNSSFSHVKNHNVYKVQEPSSNKNNLKLVHNNSKPNNRSLNNYLELSIIISKLVWMVNHHVDITIQNSIN